MFLLIIIIFFLLIFYLINYWFQKIILLDYELYTNTTRPQQ